jgi:hypothetical protein
MIITFKVKSATILRHQFYVEYLGFIHAFKSHKISVTQRLGKNFYCPGITQSVYCLIQAT